VPDGVEGAAVAPANVEWGSSDTCGLSLAFSRLARLQASMRQQCTLSASDSVLFPELASRLNTKNEEPVRGRPERWEQNAWRPLRCQDTAGLLGRHSKARCRRRDAKMQMQLCSVPLGKAAIYGSIHTSCFFRGPRCVAWRGEPCDAMTDRSRSYQ
jgi:hypothetical protein